MEQEIWKLVLEYLAAKERGEWKEAANLEERLQDWLRKDPLHQQELDQAIWLWESTAVQPQSDAWKSGFAAIQNALETEKPAQKKPTFKIWLGAAAAVVAAMSIFILFNKNRPVLTEVVQTAWTTKTSAPGKITNIILPDSTEILLNAGSSISFPNNFRQASMRTVKLVGEAYFKVKRDPNHPFVVHSSNIQTLVLGTSFNISAWGKSSPEVTVLTGKVAVSRDSAGKQSAAIQLLPNQKAGVDLTSGLLYRKQLEDARTAIGWTEGKMTFDQTPMEEVFATIERRYGVQVVTDRSFKDCKLSAKFGNINIKEVLQTLQMTLDIHYTINKQTIYIKGGKCN
ncbi:FecR family protein [Pedobacter polysacchareus]|uniref:FecR family protein n=1 Tax=Pedobacter polysacchareus TaxID=2861973 RepID=UPI001C9A2541|nr:FecR domain-containing protein [Pedobacter polysacchareus]